MRYTSRRALAVALIASTIGFGLYGCSSDPSAGSAPPRENASSDCARKAAETTDNYLERAKADPFPTEKTDGSVIKGKNIWYIGVGLAIPPIAQMGDALKEAAAATGATLTLFDGKGSAGTQSQGIQNAIAAGADGIILSAISASSIPQAVKAANDAGIPVLDGLNGIPDSPLAEGVAAQVSPSFNELADMQVNYALNATGCDLDIATIASNSLPSTKAYAEKVQSVLTELCPTCKNTQIDLPPTEITTKVAPQLQTTIQRNPDINAVLLASDSAAPYAQQALDAVGSKAMLIGYNGSHIAVAMKQPTNLAADALYAPPTIMGWFYWDGMIRALNGEKYSGKIPLSLMDKSTWGTDPDLLALQPQYAKYFDTFKSLWGTK